MEVVKVAYIVLTKQRRGFRNIFGSAVNSSQQRPRLPRMSSAARAHSISSASSDGSSSDVEAQTNVASTSRLPASRNLSGIGYRPPRDFSPVLFSKTSVLNEKALSRDKGREAWAFRVPAGISPSQLDGLVMKIPAPDSRDDDDVPLASVKALATSGGETTFNMYFSRPESKREHKRAKQSSSESQLTTMASAGSLNPSNPNKKSDEEGNADAAAGQGAAAELAGLHLLVPAGDGSDPGRLVLGKCR